MSAANKTWHGHQPWNLVKSKHQEEREFFLTLLHVTLENMRVCGILLIPIIPETANRLLDRLGVSARKRTLGHLLEPHVTSEKHKPLGSNTGVLVKVRDDSVEENSRTVSNKKNENSASGGSNKKKRS